jgi:uncharacterized membrane protein YfcA
MSVELGDLSPWLLLVAPVVVVLAYTVMGLTGFGSTIVSVPILAHFLPISFLVPMMAAVDLICAAFIGGRGRKEVSREELKRLLPYMFVGLVIGATVLVGVPDRYLRAALGIFAVAIGIHGIFNPVLHRTISRLWSIPAGIAAGAVSTIFGAGGPIYAIYLSGRLRDKGEMRATVSALITVSAFSRAVIYALSGLLLHLSLLIGAVVLAPFVWIGMKVGGRIHVGLTQEQMRRVIGVVLSIAGVSLLVRSAIQFAG